MPKIGAAPPTEIRIFQWGKNQTTEGVLLLDQAGAQMAMATFATQGNAGVFDLWHSMFDESIKPVDKETVGNYRLELRGTEKSGEGGLFAVGCQFIPEIAAAISAGKWPYLSPAVAHTKTGRIVGIRNLALVGIPATHNAQPLLLSLLSLPSSSKKANTMKILRTAYTTGQRLLRDLKQLADGGEQATRDFANSFLSALGPQVAACGQLLGEAMPSDDVVSAELSAADKGGELLLTLCADFGTTDPEELEGKIGALQIRQSAAGTSAAAEVADRAAATKLLSENSAKLSATDLAKYKGKSLKVVTSLLSGLKDSAGLPGLVLEAEPKHPTAEEIAAAQPKKGDEALTVAKLSALESDALTTLLAVTKSFDAAADTAAITTKFLSDTQIARKGK